ncbi:MAG: SMC family ATPase [Anaerolineaceae bacterium]|nr:SMC family ATPase [Anaerolineaceae bacterium]
MIPIKLTLEGFTSYRRLQSIDFTDFDVACISGQNGAGKSSLLDAITFALYGKARKNDEAIINTASKKASVTLDFDYEQTRYRVLRSITRGKGGQVDFLILSPDGETWKTLSERTATETNAKIERTLRLDYETFINASFFLQGKADSFAMKKPSERKQILASILGLDEWERYRELAREKRAQKETELAANKSKFDECQKEIDQEPKRQQELSELEKEKALVHARLVELQLIRQKQQSEEARLKGLQENLERLKLQLQKAKKEEAETQSLIAKRQQQLNVCQQELENADRIKAELDAYKATRSKQEAFDALQAQVRPLEDRRKDLLAMLEKEKALLDSQLQSLRQEKTRMDADSAQIKELEAQAAALEAELQALQKQTQPKPAREAELGALQEKAGSLQAEMKQMESRGLELNERMARLDQVQEAHCPLCGQPLSGQDRQALIQDLESERNTSRGLYAGKKNECMQALRSMDDLRTEIQSLNRLEEKLNNGRVQFAGLSRRLEILLQNQSEWQTTKARQLQALERQLSEESFLPELKAQLTALEQELAKSGYDPLLHASLRQQVKEGAAIQTQVNHLELAANEAKNHRQTLAELESRLTKQQEESQKITQEHDLLATKLAAESAGLADGRQTEQELRLTQEEEARVLRFLGGAQQRLKAIECQREYQKKLTAQAEEMRKEIDRFKQLEKAFGKDGVPALLIEQALPELQENADGILKRLTNDAMTVFFVTQKEYKDNKRKDRQDTLDILISDGGSTRDYETYSGGEAFRVNFAIRLALSHVLAHRAGARLQTLVIDEGFGNQDAEGRDKLVQALNEVSRDFAKVLVITHIDELKDIFSTRIEVGKTPEGSVLEVIHS